MVIVPFPFVEAILAGGRGATHLRLNNTTLFADEKSTFVWGARVRVDAMAPWVPPARPRVNSA